MDGTNVADLSEILGNLHLGIDAEMREPVQGRIARVQISVTCPTNNDLRTASVASHTGDSSASNDLNQDKKTVLFHQGQPTQTDQGSSISVACLPDPALQFIDLHLRSGLQTGPSFWSAKPSEQIWVEGTASVVSNIDIGAFTELWVEISMAGPDSLDLEPDLSQICTQASQCYPSETSICDRALHSLDSELMDDSDMCTATPSGLIASIPWLKPQGFCYITTDTSSFHISNQGDNLPSQTEGSPFPSTECPRPQHEEMAFQKQYWAARLALACWILAVLLARRYWPLLL